MSFPRYERYKDSGVEWLGKVPEHWDVYPLKRIAHLQSGDTINSDSIEPTGDHPVFGGNGLRGFASTFTHEGLHVLIGRQGALCGNVNYADGTFFASEHAIVVTPKRCVHLIWLGELLRAMDLNQYSIASAQPGLSVDNVTKLFIPVPSSSEQIAIGNFLRQETAKIDGLIEEQQRLIELLKEKRQAVISHAVTRGLNSDTVWRDWKVKHVISRLEQGWSPQCENAPAEGDEWSILKVGCVNYGVFNPKENKVLPADIPPEPSLGIVRDDVLISRANTRELVGSTAVAESDYPRHLLCDKLYRLKVRKTICLSKFLALYMGTPRVRTFIEAAATGASQSMVNIGQHIIANLPISLPSIREQREIITVVAVSGPRRAFSAI